MKKNYSIRLCDETAELVAEIAKKASLELGVVATSSRVIEAALMKYAKRLSIKDIRVACKRSKKE